MWFPCIKWLPAVEFKAPKFCPHPYCNFLRYGAVTSIKWWWSALTESQLPICIVLHLFWMVTLSRTIQVKLRIIFQVKVNPCLSPEINGSSIFEQVFCPLIGKLQNEMIFSIVFVMPYSVESLSRGHPATPLSWLLNTSSTVVELKNRKLMAKPNQANCLITVFLP